jgi:hypothetical protein
MTTTDLTSRNPVAVRRLARGLRGVGLAAAWLAGVGTAGAVVAMRETEEHEQPPPDRRADPAPPGLQDPGRPRPASHTSTSPTTRVDTDTASHQANLPVQPNPSQFMLVCTRQCLVVPPMIAPEATTGACWDTTSPVTLAPLASSTVEHHQVADLLALGDVGPAGQDHQHLAVLPNLGPGGRRQPTDQDSEDCDSTQVRHDRPYGARGHFVVRGSQRLRWVRPDQPTT